MLREERAGGWADCQNLTVRILGFKLITVARGHFDKLNAWLSSK